MADARDPTPQDLSVLLADDIECVCEALNLDVRGRTPRKLLCMSPFAPGRRPKLEVEVFPKRGKWNDWNMGRYGDTLGLVAYALGFEDPKSRDGLRRAIQWAKEYLGYGAQGFDHEAWARRREQAQQRAAALAAKAQRELAKNRKTAFNLWFAASPLAAGDVAFEYLRARGVDLAAMGRNPGSLRLSMAQDWFDEDGEVRHVGPCLMAAMTLPDGKFGALHRTWLDPERPGQKADLSRISDRAAVRKMWPEAAGCAIRLWRGESGLSEKDAQARGLIEDMVVCEGIEDGLSIATMTPELRVQAAGSLPGLLAWTPPKHVRTVIVAADNDWGKPQAQALLDRACRRLAEDFGKGVRIARSPEGKDFNDLLRERG